MIIHYKREDGELGAGKFNKNIPGGRTSFTTMDGCAMQVDNQKIVGYTDGPVCWRCWNTRKVFAKVSRKHFKCPACEYRTNYDAKFSEEIKRLNEQRTAENNLT